MQKAAAGVSIAITGVMIEATGLSSGEASPWSIRLVLSALPAFFLGASALLLLRFRLDQAEHGAVRARLGAVPQPAGLDPR